MFSAGKIKILNALLLISFLFGYLEWGVNQHAFIFQAEGEILSGIFNSPQSVLHPFILIPLAGQITLLYLILSKKTLVKLNYAAIISLAVLIGFLFIIGIFSKKLQVLLSTLPFLVIMSILFQQLKKQSRVVSGTKS